MKTEAAKIIGPGEVKPTSPKFRVRGIFNPAAVRLPNNKIMLFARVAETPYHDDKTFLAPRFAGRKEMKIAIDKIPRSRMRLENNCFRMNSELTRLPTISHFRKILLGKSGFNVESISQKPDFYGIEGEGEFGVEDPRITELKKEKKYAMTYVCVSRDAGVSTSLAVSKNLKQWKREGIIFRQQNKDVAIFPEKINGYYAALNRPEGTMIFDRPSIWISYSKDLKFWGKDKPIMRPRNGYWDGLRIGPSTVPLKTEEGWLEIYHGVQHIDPAKSDSPKIYKAGAVLLGLKNPGKIIARTPVNEPLIKPEYDFEKEGFVKNVVFPSSAIPGLDKKSLIVYSGAADTLITARKIQIKEIMNSLR